MDVDVAAPGGNTAPVLLPCLVDAAAGGHSRLAQAQAKAKAKWVWYGPVGAFRFFFFFLSFFLCALTKIKTGPAGHLRR